MYEQCKHLHAQSLLTATKRLQNRFRIYKRRHAATLYREQGEHLRNHEMTRMTYHWKTPRYSEPKGITDRKISISVFSMQFNTMFDRIRNERPGQRTVKSLEWSAIAPSAHHKKHAPECRSRCKAYSWLRSFRGICKLSAQNYIRYRGRQAIFGIF